MRDYAKVIPTFWTGETGKAIRKGGPGGGGAEGVIVALYLMSAPGSNMLGLYYQSIPSMAHETGLGIEGASKGLARCIEAGFCLYDEATEFVWVKEMAGFQVAKELKPNDNRCAGIQRDYDSLPGSPFLGLFFDAYASAFHLKNRRGGEGPSKPLRSQEQEQEQEQGKESSSLRSDSSSTASTTGTGAGESTTGKTADLVARRAQRLSAVTDDAIAAYNGQMAKPIGKLPAVSTTVGRRNRLKNVERCLTIAAEICTDQFGDKKITPEFWAMYFAACLADDFCSGVGPYVGAHANWRPDFEYLTRPATMLKIFERATDQAEVG